MLGRKSDGTVKVEAFLEATAVEDDVLIAESTFIINLDDVFLTLSVTVLCIDSNLAVA